MVQKLVSSSYSTWSSRDTTAAISDSHKMWQVLHN